MLKNVEQLTAIVVDTSFKMHKNLGPGMLESAYEKILFEKLLALGLHVDRQHPVNITYDGIFVENAFRVDLLVEKQLVVELKSLEKILPVHAKQVLTYIRLMGLPIGILINFNASIFSEGVRRLVNNHTDFASSRLRANQQ